VSTPDIAECGRPRDVAALSLASLVDLPLPVRTLHVASSVPGSAHPDTLATADRLELLRSEMRGKQPTKKGAKAAARKEPERAAAAS
jgi:hypothetical protein